MPLLGIAIMNCKGLQFEWPAKRAEEDHHVHLERPVPQVEQVHIDPFLHFVQIAGGAHIAHHLCQSGDTGFHFMPVAIVFHFFLVVQVIAQHMWPWADDRHVAPEHIQELR